MTTNQLSEKFTLKKIEHTKVSYTLNIPYYHFIGSEPIILTEPKAHSVVIDRIEADDRDSESVIFRLQEVDKSG